MNIRIESRFNEFGYVLDFRLETEDKDFRDQMSEFIRQAVAGNAMFVDGKTQFKKGDEFEPG